MTEPDTRGMTGAMRLPAVGDLKDHAIGISTAAIALFDNIEHGTISEAGVRAINEIGRLHDLIVGEIKTTAAIAVARGMFDKAAHDG